MILLGDAMRILRVREGISQQDLSDRTGISYTDISMLECNQMGPPDDWMQRIKAALNWDVRTEQGLAFLKEKADDAFRRDEALRQKEE